MNGSTGTVGRPSGPHDETLDKVLPTARRLLSSEGTAALTPTRLHHETGVSRATIYRNWPDATHLVSALLSREAETSPPSEPSSHPAEELAPATAQVLHRLADPELCALMLAGIESARRSPDAAAATREFLTALFAPVAQVVTAAVDHGLVEGEIEALVADLVGPLLADRILIDQADEDERARDLARRFLVSHRPSPVGNGESVRSLH